MPFSPTLTKWHIEHHQVWGSFSSNSSIKGMVFLRSPMNFKYVRGMRRHCLFLSRSYRLVLIRYLLNTQFNDYLTETSKGKLTYLWWETVKSAPCRNRNMTVREGQTLSLSSRQDGFPSLVSEYPKGFLMSCLSHCRRWKVTMVAHHSGQIAFQRYNFAELWSPSPFGNVLSPPENTLRWNHR